MSVNPVITEAFAEARVRAAEPVRVPWREAWRGFRLGFVMALVPAIFVTSMVADVVPLGRLVLHGTAARVFAVVIALAVGAAYGVCRVARAYHGNDLT